MTQNTSLLVLRLEGALQSWGEQAKWDDRDSASMPTKSGVVGLLACAMGLERESPEIAALSENIQIAVRADRPGRKTVDYQTITGNHLLNAEGKKRSLGDTFISRRTYLEDASFLVVIAAAKPWAEKIADALKNPVWCPYLGRKNCIPSCPILLEEHPKETDILTLLKTYPPAARAVYPMTFETEIPLPGCACYTRPDQRRAGYRRFDRRMVWRGILEEERYVSDED